MDRSVRQRATSPIVAMILALLATVGAGVLIYLYLAT